MENNSELGEMRQQISLLKGKLNDQEIVNDSIIRKVVQEKMDTINKAGWGIVVFGILEIPLVLWVFKGLCGFSWLFCIITALYVLATLIFQISMNVLLQRQIHLNDNLLEVSKQLVNMKRRNMKQLYFAFPFTILWTGLLIWEVYKNQGIGELDFQTVAFIIIFGVVMGVVVGLSVFFKRYNAMKDLISQIEMFLPKKSQIFQNKLDDALQSITDLH
jgi:hypothetical protein